MASLGSAVGCLMVLKCLFDPIDRMAGQVLRDLRQNFRFSLFMKMLAHLAERLGRSDDDQTFELVGQRGTIDPPGRVCREPILGLLVKIGLARARCAALAGAGRHPASLIGLDVMIGLVGLLFGRDHFQVKIFGVALVAEEKHLRAVGDEDITVMGNAHRLRLL